MKKTDYGVKEGYGTVRTVHSPLKSGSFVQYGSFYVDQWAARFSILV